MFGILELALLAGCAPPPSCGEGFEQQGDSCVPVCVEECGEHQACKVTADSAQCECVAGYAGAPCEWTGGLQDPEFTSEESWSKTNGATVLPLATTTKGQGVASFESSVACNAGAVSQVVEMPSYEDAEPFVIEVDYRFENVSVGVEVGYGRAFRRLRSKVPEWNTDRFCLGEAGYGGPVKFQIAASERTRDCFSGPVGSIEVDRFEILVADEGECPPPGELLNSEANVGAGGWIFDVESSGTGAGMYTQLSVRLASSTPSPALRFWWKGNADWRYYVDLGTYPGTRSTVRPLNWLFGNGDPQTSTYCLPPWTHGNVVDLSFVTLGGFFADEAELVVDNVEIVSDERCGDSTDLLDPSFDSAPHQWPGVNIIPGQEPGSGVRVTNDSNRANPPGPGLLELRYAGNDVELDVHAWVWVPPSEECRGVLSGSSAERGTTDRPRLAAERGVLARRMG